MKSKQLYVAKFSNGHIKIGVGCNAKDRIKAHIRFALKHHDARLESSWQSVRHINYIENEKKLIELTKNATVSGHVEWSDGLSFDDIVSVASSFEYRTEMTNQERINENTMISLLSSPSLEIKASSSKASECVVINFTKRSSLDIAYKVCLGRTVSEYMEHHQFKKTIDPNKTLTPLEFKCINELVAEDEKLVDLKTPYNDRINRLEELYIQRHAKGLCNEIKALEY